MALTITSKMRSQGDSVYYQDAWHILVETHLPVLRGLSDTALLTVDVHDAYKYRGDLYSLLQAYDQPPEYLFPIMRMNGMYSPSEYRESMLSLMVPSIQTMENLRKNYQQVSAKIN